MTESTQNQPLSGHQFALASGDLEAVVASIGASVRRLTVGGRDMVVPFEEDEVRPSYRGAVLAPWPNRVVNGVWSLDGGQQRLALTEPERGHALHGLAAWLDFAPLEVAADRVVLEATIEPQTGYPFRVRVEVDYRLDADGLTTRVTLRNVGAGVAPVGAASHPYLVAGDGRVDDWTVQLRAESVMTVTPDRLVPIEIVPVAGALDLRTPRTLGGSFIDHAFTGLPEGEVELTVMAEHGRGVGMRWLSESCPWVQVHTADRPDPSESRLGLAVEPMTCPPDAFNSGTDVARLAPGASTSAGWTIFPIR